MRALNPGSRIPDRESHISYPVTRISHPEARISHLESRIPNLARLAPLSCGGARSESRGEAETDVDVLDGTRLEAFLAAGTLHPAESLYGFC